MLDTRKPSRFTRLTVAALAIILCATPTAALNIWPRLSQVLEKGAASSDEVGLMAFLAATLVVMAAAPFAIPKIGNWGWKASFLGLVALFVAINYGLAVHTVGGSRDLDAKSARELARQAATLVSRIERLTKSRNLLPQVPPAVNQGVIDAANQAVALADDARVRECDGGNGGNCRLRVAELKAATEARAPLLEKKAIADQIARTEADLRDAQDERKALGNVSEVGLIEKGAIRLAKQIEIFVDLGSDPVGAVSDGIVAVIAAGFELLDLLGPKLLMTALYGSDPPRAPRERWWRRVFPRPAAAAPQAVPEPAPEPAPAPVAAVEAAPVAPTPATAAKARKPSKIKRAAVRELGDVREWKESRTVARADGKVKPSEAHAAYRGWCAEQDRDAVSLTMFGTIMKRELGVVYEETSPGSNRGYYVGVALVGSPRLAVVNAG